VGLAREKPQHVLELGIYQGGSLVFFERLFRPERVVGIELETNPIPALDRYIERGSVIRPYLGTSQDDRERLDEILSSEFPDGIDLIVDDASHRYGPSRLSFEICFPHLKPNGLYILEDWSWSMPTSAPIPRRRIRGLKRRRAKLPDHPKLADLLAEWVVSIGSSSAIAEMTVRPKMAILRKSARAKSDGEPAGWNGPMSA
jgi:predicted O-methyltransferase YrrM